MHLIIYLRDSKLNFIIKFKKNVFVIVFIIKLIPYNQ
jgi:hypothetical protein